MDRLFDFVTVVKVVGKRGVDFGKGEIIITGDLVGAHAHALMPDGNVLHSDAVPGNARLATANARCNFDELIQVNSEGSHSINPFENDYNKRGQNQFIIAAMPELPEVETTVRRLREPCVGQRIVDVTIHWARHISTPSPKQFRQRIRDQKIESITRRAKYLIFNLESSFLLIHLKMSGRLEVVDAATPRNKHDHTIFHFANGREMRFNDTRKFGKVYLVDDVDDVTGHLGPEPLEESFTTKRLGEILHAHHKPMKTFLLDQTLLAGVGNIYADESLHRAKIHPQRYSNSLKPDDVKKLWRSIRHTLNLAIKHNGSSIDWVYPQGEHQNHFRVYDRADEPCYTCGRSIRRIVMGGRSTHFCSGCQHL